MSNGVYCEFHITNMPFSDELNIEINEAYTVTIANDVIEVLLPALATDDANHTFNMPAYEQRVSMIKDALIRSNVRNSIFTSENIIKVVENCSTIIARAVNMWLGVEP